MGRVAFLSSRLYARVSRSRQEELLCVLVFVCVKKRSKWKSVFFSEFVEMVLVFFTAISDDVSDENMYIRKKCHIVADVVKPFGK